jgi:hypothetical protein
MYSCSFHGVNDQMLKFRFDGKISPDAVESKSAFKSCAEKGVLVRMQSRRRPRESVSEAHETIIGINETCLTSE